MTKILQALAEEELTALQKQTIADYHNTADSFWAGTKDHDVSQNVEALLRNIEGTAPFKILDFGCGPGRDLMAFKQLGHHPTGLDGCPNFVEMAKAHADCPVWLQNFLELDLPDGEFDGVFANASMFHVPTQELSRVLGELKASLKTRGILFCSNPRGPDLERFSRERYGAFLSYETWFDFVTQAGFQAVEHYYRPQGKPRDQQPWLASVWRKID